MAQAVTLKDVVAQLKHNQKASDQTNKKIGELTTSLNKSFTMFFEQKKAERLDMDALQAARDANNKNKTTFTKNYEAGQEAGQKSLSSFGDLLDLGKMFGPLLAALPLAIVGMRGWEIPVIKKLAVGLVEGVGKLADSFKLKMTNGIDDMMRSVLKSFGINPATGKMLRDARGRFTGREMKTTAVMISEAFDLLRLNVTQAFGVGTDGGKIGRIVAKAGNLMKVIISPLISVGSAISGWAAGPGAKLLGFMDSVLGISGGVANIGKFAGFVGKILKPIGFLFSAYDGVMAFMNTEGSFMDKFVAGIGAFIGDFVGAPLDLLKDIVGWALDALGFENAAKWLEGWSFETIINNMIGGIWTMVQSAVDWVKLLFTDPGQALSDLFWGYIGLYESIGEWIYNIAVKPLWTWFENTFPDLSAWISNAWNEVVGPDGLGAWIWDNSIGPLWDWLANTFSWENIKTQLGLPDWMINWDSESASTPPPSQEGTTGHWRTGPRGGKFWVAGPVQPSSITTVPKTTGQQLQQEQAALNEVQNRGPRGGSLVANSGNTVVNNNSAVTSIQLGNGAAPNPYDRPAGARAAYLAGYGTR